MQREGERRRDGGTRTIGISAEEAAVLGYDWRASSFYILMPKSGEGLHEAPFMGETTGGKGGERHTHTHAETEMETQRLEKQT